MDLSDFDYHLPEGAIAQHPINPRDHSKLMVVDPLSGSFGHHHFYDLPNLLPPDSVLILNESRVIPARLELSLGDGKAEILLTKVLPSGDWLCMVKPGKKFPEGKEWEMGNLKLEVKEVTPEGLRIIGFKVDNFEKWLEENGKTPTPPYIKEELKDTERYQTVYAKEKGSVAAPTAGLHFTAEVFKALEERGIQTEFITLHVGLGTFQAVKTEKIEEHKMHSEWFSLNTTVAQRLNEAKKQGRPIIAVGTTTVRVLESCANENGQLTARSGETDIFIKPGYRWKYVDGMVTNFHVPKSTLLMLVSAFAGRELMLNAYQEALQKNYRFFSFGDAMFIRRRKYPLD